MSPHVTALEKLPGAAQRPGAVSSYRPSSSRLRQHPSWMHVTLALLMGTTIGIVDRSTGSEISLYVLYALPIVYAVWFAGLRAGLGLALIVSLVWWLANAADRLYETQWGYNWAMMNRMMYFSFVAVGVSAIRRRQEADARQIRMLEEMRHLEQEIVSAGEREQQRIGQDLHDGLCQQLAAIGCAARALADDLHARSMPEAQDAEKIEQNIQQTVLEARTLARGIFPVHVDRSGLSTALAELARATTDLTGISIVLKESLDVEVADSEVSMHFYRIAQEAVGNAVRHSGATEVALSLDVNDGNLVLCVDDNGKGMPSGNSEISGMGLRTMSYRAQAMGAELSIKPRPGGGTRVLCKLGVKTHDSRHDYFYT